MDGCADGKTLVEEILSGNQQAFRQFIEKYERLVRQIVFRMLPNRADREDISQDIFVKIYRNLSGFRFDAKLSTWAGRIAYNTCLNHLDKSKSSLLDGGECEDVSCDTWADLTAMTEEFAETRELSIKVAREIDRLPVMYGVIVSLFHLQEMRYGEIADILQMPIGTVKSYLFRGRRMLKERLLAKYRVEELCA
jgi:RNA polymerase sigma-70 factor (ECF subfamily)